MEDFSFSGLTTSVALTVKKNREELKGDEKLFADVCWAIQDGIVDPLVVKVSREVSARRLPLVVCGGVSANAELRRRLTQKCATVYFPPMKHCIDNGAMIVYVDAR